MMRVTSVGTSITFQTVIGGQPAQWKSPFKERVTAIRKGISEEFWNFTFAVRKSGRKKRGKVKELDGVR